MSSRKTVFRALSILLSLLIGLTVVFLVEFALKWRQNRIAGSERLDDHFVRYDNYLGWTLTPNWTGNHRHFDFEARYEINAEGFRADAPFPGRGVKAMDERRILIVGDSFTFGIGVNDTETFVAHLNSESKGKEHYFNLGVPGYSTDQQALMIEREAYKWSSDVVLLMVYVGNDFFDNQLAFPLQVNGAKPFFKLAGGELHLENVPIPHRKKNPEESRITLDAMVRGKDAERKSSLLERLQARSAILALTSDWKFFAPAETGDDFAARFRNAILLYSHLCDRIRRACQKEGAELVIGVLAGRSFAESPHSLSARYQDFFRQEVIRQAREKGLGVVDLASAVKGRFAQNRQTLFFPHEGHLNSAGHQVVAGELRSFFDQAIPPSPLRSPARP